MKGRTERAQNQAQEKLERPSKGGALEIDFQRENRPERATGLEPATSSLGSWHSTN